MLKPLQQYICDTCGQIIENPGDGWVEWIREDEYSHSFRITHQHSKSPLGGREGCYHHGSASGRCDDHLDSFMKHLMPNLLMFIDIGPHHDPDGTYSQRIDKRSFAELARRLTIPYYEEARLYWPQAREDGLFDGANEITMYTEEFCKNLIRKYGKY